MLIIDRLGKVLYWVSCFAALQFAVATALALWTEMPISAVSFALLSFACWVWGWFSKYILIEFVKPALRDFAADAKGRMAPKRSGLKLPPADPERLKHHEDITRPAPHRSAPASRLAARAR